MSGNGQDANEPIGVLFVCLGNICRSPAAEGTFRHLIAAERLEHRFRVDSAGTSAFHIGEGANPNSQRAAKKYGIRLESRARQFVPADFAAFDYILAMDGQNYRDILAQAASPADRERVSLFRTFDPAADSGSSPDVPDPYYGGAAGFDKVQDIMNRTTRGLLDHILRERGG